MTPPSSPWPGELRLQPGPPHLISLSHFPLEIACFLALWGVQGACEDLPGPTCPSRMCGSSPRRTEDILLCCGHLHSFHREPQEKKDATGLSGHTAMRPRMSHHLLGGSTLLAMCIRNSRGSRDPRRQMASYGITLDSWRVWTSVGSIHEPWRLCEIVWLCWRRSGKGHSVPRDGFSL